MKAEGKNRQPKAEGSFPRVGTARRAVRLFVGRASRLPSIKMRPKAGGTSPIAGGTPALQWSRGARPPSGVPPRAPRGGLETNAAGRLVELFVKSGAGHQRRWHRRLACVCRKAKQPHRQAWRSIAAHGRDGHAPFSNNRGGCAAKVGRLRRGIPTNLFRRALPRHLCVRCLRWSPLFTLTFHLTKPQSKL